MVRAVSERSYGIQAKKVYVKGSLVLLETRYEHTMLNEDQVPSIAGTTMVVQLVVEQQAY